MAYPDHHEVFPLAQHLRFADLQTPRLFVRLHPPAFSPRVTERYGSIVLNGGLHHMLKLVLVLRRHNDHVGHRAHVSEIEYTVMRRSIGTHQTSSVEGEDHMQILDADIVQDLIVAALQEGGIDRHDRCPTLGRHSCRKGHRMLLGNTDIIGAAGKLARQFIDAGAAPHGSRDSHHFRVFFGQPDQRGGKDVREGRDRTLFLLGFTRQDVERTYAMVLDRILLGRPISFPFPADHVHKRGPPDILYVLKGPDHLRYIVAVDGPYV